MYGSSCDRGSVMKIFRFDTIWSGTASTSLEISQREPGAIYLHFKIAPGSWGFGMNQGQFQMNQRQFSKYSSMLPEYNKVRTQRDRISLISIMKTSKITPEGKFTVNVRIYVIYYLCDVSPRAQFDSKLLRPVVDYLLPTGAMGSFTRANLRRCARYFKACL